MKITERTDAHADVYVEKTMNEIVEILVTENIKEASDIEHVKISMQMHFTKYADKFRTSKAKYANEIREFCHHVGYIPYEATKNTWEDLKETLSMLEDGCAICMVYDEFVDTYLSSVEKLSSILKMNWKNASRIGKNSLNVSKKELIDMRNRLSATGAWLRLYHKN